MGLRYDKASRHSILRVFYAAAATEPCGRLSQDSEDLVAVASGFEANNMCCSWRWYFFTCALLQFVLPPRLWAQVDAKAPPTLGFVKNGHVFSLVLRKKASGTIYSVLSRASVVVDSGQAGGTEHHLAYAHGQDRFLPWHVAHGSIWLNEGQVTTRLSPDQGMRVPESDLALFNPDLDRDQFTQKYGNHLISAHYLCLSHPVGDGENRAITDEGRRGPCYFDAVPLSETHVVALVCAAGKLSVWQGHADGPRERPTFTMKWKEAGKESKAGFDEPFVGFACGRELVVVTQSGNAFRVMVPTGDAPVRIDPLWNSVGRPIEAVITDVDRDVTYAFSAPAAGANKGFISRCRTQTDARCIRFPQPARA